jgi:dTDP-glucose 4,6-dehydratase
VNLDLLTYAGNLENLSEIDYLPNYRFIHGDICDEALIAQLFQAERIDAVINFAAESHVDRSISGPEVFIKTNVIGTFYLLEAARNYWDKKNSSTRFLHVSTDEVYGSLEPDDSAFTETSPFAPNSPYAASKAASDHLVRAYYHTYGVPVVTTNCSNNYGPYQFPEKLIPLVILNALEGKEIPVYGKGANVRDWLHVEDHCRAIDLVLKKGRLGETYNIGGNNEWMNIDVVKLICDRIDEIRPSDTARTELIAFVKDRPGHDMRYAIDAGKMSSELGWEPCHTFASGINQTVDWYLENTFWWQRVRNGAYREYYEKQYSG